MIFNREKQQLMLEGNLLSREDVKKTCCQLYRRNAGISV